MEQQDQDRVFIYDLNQPSFLKEDINEILDRISELYEVRFFPDREIFTSKTTTNSPFASTGANDTFNKLVPKLKSLIKDMYSIIEGVYKAGEDGFKKLKLEKEYEYLREFRVLNNKLKHHNDREAEFTLTMVHMHDFGINRIDCNVQFWFKKEDERSVVNIADLIKVFLTILEDKGIVEIDRGKVVD